ncbi:ribonuclease HII [uncultured Pseudoflavonifractor sp.]|uniref:ribonuclease HII n=1 Tax=uncultured Pseudoflavonifractor sp. TaxID=1221379 RepID=UPI0025E09670|nr:ribonuclease HII [uncultured Pseudoflavonifractor sp.]
MKQKVQADLWEIERSCKARGYQLICGADEAGAGPLAGPVYAGAVILPEGLVLEGLNDSKKVTPKRRDWLFDEIREKAVAWAVASVDEKEIDAINILNARMKAMELAIQSLIPAPDYALIDGNRDKGITIAHETVVRGDGRSANIAAASILAKVSRDRYMEEMAKLYPEYEFERHKGYGTKLHFELLKKYGPCPIHRKSFLKKMEAAQSKG